MNSRTILMICLLFGLEPCLSAVSAQFRSSILAKSTSSTHALSKCRSSSITLWRCFIRFNMDSLKRSGRFLNYDAV
jgi:hypothetical protein